MKQERERITSSLQNQLSESLSAELVDLVNGKGSLPLSKLSTNIYFLGMMFSTEQQVSGSVRMPNKESRSQAITWRCRNNWTKILLNMRLSAAPRGVTEKWHYRERTFLQCRGYAV
jgi:hypothetical protein